VDIQKVNPKGALMRRVAIILISMTLFACGGGGGGGGGTSEPDTDIIYSNDYTNRDVNKVYTFKQTQIDGNNTQSENTISYRYAQVNTIPSKYNYSGSIPGPYTVETMQLDGVDKSFTYISSSGIIISDDSTVFTNIDHSESVGTIPPDWTVGTVYSKTSTEDLFRSTTGIQVGTKTTEYTLKALGVENVTVPAGTFQSVKTEETSEITYTYAGFTEIRTATWSFWYSSNLGYVKITSNTTVVSTEGSDPPITSTYIVTNELTSVSP